MTGKALVVPQCWWDRAPDRGEEPVRRRGGCLLAAIVLCRGRSIYDHCPEKELVGPFRGAVYVRRELGGGKNWNESLVGGSEVGVSFQWVCGTIRWFSAAKLICWSRAEASETLHCLGGGLMLPSGCAPDRVDLGLHAM